MEVVDAWSKRVFEFVRRSQIASLLLSLANERIVPIPQMDEQKQFADVAAPSAWRVVSRDGKLLMPIEGCPGFGVDGLISWFPAAQPTP